MIIATNGEKKLLRVDKSGKVQVGTDRFPAQQLVGLPYGSVLAVDGRRIVADDRLPEDINGIAREWESAMQAGDTGVVEDRSNKELFDDGTAQKLSGEDIERLKADGLAGDELVSTLARNSATFESKTAFSQHKWLKKKAQKYTPVVQLLETTPTELCEMYAHTQRLDRIHALRADALALSLERSNVRAGSRALVVETGAGVLTAGLAERLGGEGELLIAHVKPRPALDAIHQLNLEHQHWAAVRTAPLDDVLDALEGSVEAADAGAPGAAPAAAEAEGAGGSRAVHVGRKAARLDKAGVRAWLDAGADSLVVCMRATPVDLLQQLLRAVRPSGSVVVYNSFVQSLVLCVDACGSGAGAPLLNSTLYESWAREYQVLPNRTHPKMTNVEPTGHVLAAYKRAAPPAKAATAGVAARQEQERLASPADKKRPRQE